MKRLQQIIAAHNKSAVVYHHVLPPTGKIDEVDKGHPGHLSVPTVPLVVVSAMEKRMSAEQAEISKLRMRLQTLAKTLWERRRRARRARAGPARTPCPGACNPPNSTHCNASRCANLATTVPSAARASTAGGAGLSALAMRVASILEAHAAAAAAVTAAADQVDPGAKAGSKAGRMEAQSRHAGPKPGATPRQPASAGPGQRLREIAEAAVRRKERQVADACPAPCPCP